MITFDFANPYLIYVLYNILTFGSIYCLLTRRRFFIKHEKTILIVATVLLIYSQLIRYGLPYLEDRPTHPFYVCRMASIFVIYYLLTRDKRVYPLIYFFSVASLFPVLVPAGPIETIRIHNESFFLDHYIVAMVPFYLLSVKNYRPTYLDGFVIALIFGVFVFLFIPINAAMQWGYFFMNRHNALLMLLPNMSWGVFAGLFTLSIIVINRLCAHGGILYYRYRNKRF